MNTKAYVNTCWVSVKSSSMHLSKSSRCFRLLCLRESKSEWTLLENRTPAVSVLKEDKSLPNSFSLT